MRISILKWTVVLLASLNAGYMALDGALALLRGDYIRPESGTYAGQLGPWAGLVERVGIDPMSGLMKSVFVVWGLAGLLLAGGFAADKPRAWGALLIYCVCTTWYLYMGTASCVIQIVLLLVIRFLGVRR